MEMLDAPIVRVNHLSHRYSAQWAIQDVSFDIDKVGVQGLLGSNGAGKSTTMNIICGVLNQTRGDVWINDINLKDNPVWAKRNIGFLPQTPPVYPELTIQEYLVHCADIRYMDKYKIKDAVEEAMERCSIAHFRNRLLKNLSGGYLQRVGIAQAIVHHPAFVVLDEPTNGLDPNQIVEVRSLIKDIAKDRAVLISTHILSEVRAICDKILMIEKGRMVFQGSMDEFRHYIKPSSFVVEFAKSVNESELLSIDGVSNVQQIGANRFRVYFINSTDITQRFVKESVAKEWGVVEIILDRSSLDEIFACLSGKHN